MLASFQDASKCHGIGSSSDVFFPEKTKLPRIYIAFQTVEMSLDVKLIVRPYSHHFPGIGACGLTLPPPQEALFRLVGFAVPVR